MDLITTIGNLLSLKLGVSLDRIASDLGDEIKQIVNNNILEYQVEEYKKNCKTKTILHRTEPKDLLEFYQPLNIKHLNQDDFTTIAKSTTLVRNLFQSVPYITLIGSAGSGKSTIVKYLFVNCYETNFKIPIIIELRYLNDFSGTVIEYIREKVFKIHNLAASEKIFDRLMNSGQFIFFLDGYDEIASAKKHIVTQNINELVSVFFRNYYLLTSRPFAGIELLPRFSNFEVCPLNDRDIPEFIRKQIPKENHELVEKIISSINLSENSIYYSFLRNPLLLSMFILTFQSYADVPQKRSEFFYQVFDTLFATHDSLSKLAYVREKQSHLQKETFLEILKVFSFLSYFQDKFYFSENYLYTQLTTIKNTKKIEFNNENLINDLQLAIGILIKDGVDYSFPHRSLQEYFSALYVASLSEENKNKIYVKIFEPLYQEKFDQKQIRDNIIVLLLELDKANIIQKGLIPLLKSLSFTKTNNMTDNKIASHFIRLRVTFKIFHSIIYSENLKRFQGSLTSLSDSYHKKALSELRKTKDSDSYTPNIEEETQIENQVEKKLISVDITNFLSAFEPELMQITQSIEYLLSSQNKGDEDIISMLA